ncbi:hypothetical protein RVR_5855 [Actinacidiphila reveromycinica]|uniref:Uncharacterized protein n=1 Tax=Actinacidiphila reveromycinica TaxID=659352 RepID=A0A7U3UV18_9ACTN|nr:hypothetical protein [Streptomyces sp. SN-593]BBA99299.1 hypothetical protein RVR_5855 [Streptomyces sp. SN-593]
MAEDLARLLERYETLLAEYSAAVRREHDELGEVKPLAPGAPIPMVSEGWKQAVGAVQEIKPKYEAARDAYREAVRGQ